MTTRILPALCLLLFLSSCSRKLIPEKPDLSQTSHKLDTLPLSEIDIPLRINLRAFYSLADRNVQSVYTSPGWPTEFVVDDCDTRYMYRFKRGPLHLRANGTQLDLDFEGQYVIAGGQRVCSGSGSNRVALSPWTPTCTCGLNEGERRVQVAFRTNIQLKKDYSLGAGIERLEPKPIDKCTVCFWGQDITATVMQRLKSQLDDARKGMLDTLTRFSLRPQFQKLWDQLNTAMPVYGVGYMQVNPEKIRISSFRARNDTMFISVGISARPLISLAPQNTRRTVIPDLSDIGNRRGFNIFFDAVLDYDSLGNIITKQFAGQRIDIGQLKKYVIIDKCELYGVNNEQLIIRLAFSGSEKGVLYLTGKPYYNKEKKQLEIRQIDYDIKTRNLLVRSAKWLFNRRIINELNKRSIFRLDDFLQPLLARINIEMNRELVSGVMAKGQVSNLQVIDLFPFTEHLLLRCNTSGDLELIVNSWKF